MNLSRRQLTGALAGGLVAALSAQGRKKFPIAVQLYSVRQIGEKDLAGVLQAVGKMGYDGVEFAGYYGHQAAAVRKLLDDNGLKVAGTHTGIDTVLGDRLEATLEYNRVIGNKNIIVPGLPEKYRNSIAAWKETAKTFEEVAARIKPQGFVLGYHNHASEFKPVEGQVPFDVFFGSSNSGVKVQLDVGHALRGGADPVEVIRRYNGRIVSVHAKEYAAGNEDVHLGKGEVKWKPVVKALQKSPGFEWYIVEEEARSCQGFECIERSLKTLRTLV